MTRLDLARCSPQRTFSALLLATLAACGGGGGSNSEGPQGSNLGSTPAAGASAPATTAETSATVGTTPTVTSQATTNSAGEVTWMTTGEAARLAGHATFGATEAVVKEIESYGATDWIEGQMLKKSSRYTLGGDSRIHTHTSTISLCEQDAYKGANCWRDWYSTQPLLWDFYRNAMTQPDQLRQRVAYALSQIVVISALEVSGTYGWRNYHNSLLDNAFGNYRTVLKKATLSPLMGDFLNNVNNDKAAPNENYARELLQLFSIGTCELNMDGSLKGGKCIPTYDNVMVRNYAYALTGWTYPAGGQNAWNLCLPQGANCRYYGGDMVGIQKYHDITQRSLLSGVTVPASSTPDSALEKVLDSVMNHPNIAPFVGRQLIQRLVMSNPSPAYTQRVAQAFAAGKFQNFGTGQRGDLAATVAAVLLDPEALSMTPAASGGKLREPVLMFTGLLRLLGGYTDGEPFAWWWGETLQQHVFRPPSVFNYYPPDYPVAGTSLRGPEFGIHNASTHISRLNFLNYVLWWGGSAPVDTVPGATGTKLSSLAVWEADSDNVPKLVDRMSVIATGRTLPAGTRESVIKAVEAFTPTNSPTHYKTSRVKQAAWLVFASPQYQIQR